MMVVRPATLDDARAITTIHVRSWQVAYEGIVPGDFLGSLSIETRETAWQRILGEQRSATYVAEESRQVIGWISVSRSRDLDAGPATGELWAIYVAPDSWGRGAGRALWSRGRLKTSGFQDATVWVLKDNRRALSFYDAAGFRAEPGPARLIELGGAQLLEIRLRQQLG